MQRLVSKSSGAADGTCGIQNTTQGLINGLFIREGFCNFWFQHNNIAPLTQTLQILGSNAALHRGKIIFRAYFVICITVSFLHKTSVHAG